MERGEILIMSNENKTYPLKLNPNYYVVSANDLIKGRQKMTLREAQLLYAAMAQIVKEDKDFKTYTTTVYELADFMGISSSSLYRDLKSICKSLSQRVVEIRFNDGTGKNAKWKVFPWISCAEYDNGVITIRLNDEIKPFLIDLMSHYSQTLLGTLCAFKSYYAIRLYQLLVCEVGEHPKKPKEEWSFTCEELRDFFQVEKDEYVRARDLFNKTIKAAIKELNSSDFAYIYDYEETHGPGKGSPLTGVRFKAVLFNDKTEKDWYMQRCLPKLEKYLSDIETNVTSTKKTAKPKKTSSKTKQ